MKNFEKHLHDHFDGREINVDKNELWANIAPQLEPAKKDRRKSWLFFFFGLTAGVALLGLYLFTQVEDHPISNSTAIATANANTLEIAGSDADTKSNFNSNTNADVNLKTTSIASTNSTATTPINTDGIANSQATRSTNLNSNFTNKTTTPTTNESFFQTSANNTITNKNKTDLSTKTAQQKIATIPLENNYDVAPMSSLSINELANAGINLNKLPVTLEEVNEDLITPSKSKLRVGIGFHAGISKTQNMLRESSQSEFLYTQLRASTEDQLVTMHLGLSAIVEIKRSIYLQAGLEYSRINSRLSLDNEIIILDTIQNLVIRHGNFTDTIGRENQYILQEFDKNNSKNSFHLLDIPVLFGYQFGKARWRAGIEAGAYINIRLQKEGQILQQDLSIYDIEKDQNNWYKTNVGIRPHLGLFSTYDLSSNYQLYFSTGITFNKTFSTNNSPITVDKSMFGIRVGGRYYF